MNQISSVANIIYIIAVMLTVIMLLNAPMIISVLKKQQSVGEAICKILRSFGELICDLILLYIFEKDSSAKRKKRWDKRVTITYWIGNVVVIIGSCVYKKWLILIIIPVWWLLTKLLGKTVSFIVDVTFDAGRELGDKWFFVSLAQLFTVVFFVGVVTNQDMINIMAQSICIKRISQFFLFSILFYMAHVQIATVKKLVGRLVKGEYRVSGNVALTVSAGLVVSQIVFFILLVWFIMFIHPNAFVTDQGQTPLGANGFLSGAVFVIMTYFSVGQSDLVPNNWLGVGVMGLIALVGLLMIAFIIAAIIDSANKEDKDNEVIQEPTNGQIEDKEAEEVKQETTDAQIEDKEAKEVHQDPTKMQTEDKGPKEKQPSRPHERGKADTKQHAKNKKRLQGRKKRK